MKGDENLPAMETVRLIDWLIANGHTAEQAAECIKYIAGVLAPAPKETKEK